VAQVSHLVSLDKSTYAVAMDGLRYLIDQPLSDLERELDPRRFFRVTRQLLVAAQAVRHYSPAGKGRLKITIDAGDAGEVFVSQERASDFKAWLQAAPAA
jgi:DNA-binding LytR/AlgR family response regulator